VAFEEFWRRLNEWGVPYETHFRDLLGNRPTLEQPDVNGSPVRTASHLVAVRDWLIEQITRESHCRFVNASGAGILHGGPLRQSMLHAVIDATAKPRTQPTRLIRSRYRPPQDISVLDSARALVGSTTKTQPDRATDEVLARWERFADGLTRERIIDTLRYAVDPPAGAPETPPPAVAGAELFFDAHWMASLAANVPLAWMPIDAVKLEPFKPGIRLLRFRTTTARLMACAFRLPDGAVAENSAPLRQGTAIDTLAPGEYFIWRDEVYIASTDGSDPRHNHRTYSVLLPKGVAHLEQQPLADILKYHF
jgi:hypothetical protein